MSATRTPANCEVASARAAFTDAARLLAEAKALSVALDVLGEQCGPGAPAHLEHAVGDGVAALARFLHLATEEAGRIEQRLNGFVERWERPAPTRAV